MSGQRLPPAGTSSRKAQNPEENWWAERATAGSHRAKQLSAERGALDRCLQHRPGSCDTAECRYCYYLIALLYNSCESMGEAHLGLRRLLHKLRIAVSPLQSMHLELQDST